MFRYVASDRFDLHPSRRVLVYHLTHSLVPVNLRACVQAESLQQKDVRLRELEKENRALREKNDLLTQEVRQAASCAISCEC